MAKILLFFAILNFVFAITTLPVNSQSQSDFISIDCGALEDYTDEITGINYATDSNYTNTGENRNISKELSAQITSQQFQSVRTFPEGQKNCYTLRPSKGKNHTYLIRARFLYGDYDGLGQQQEFDLYLGVNKWKTVSLATPNRTRSFEIVQVLQSDYVYVCLVKTGLSNPFISSLELRLLNDDTYVAKSGALDLFARVGCGLNSTSNIRYKEDGLDRMWTPFNSERWDVINNSRLVAPNTYEPPSIVMSTAVTPRDGNGTLRFSWSAGRIADEIPEFYLYLHFAELKNLTLNQLREFDIYLNGNLWYGPFVPKYLRVRTIYSRIGHKGSSFQLWINRTENSTLPPLINAFEIYRMKNLSDSETDQNDVEAISNIKSVYELNRNSWQGDPCGPKDYSWDALNCSYSGNDPPRIISLNLSWSGLINKEISSSIAQLTMLEYLDLSNNNLSGTVPEFLADLSYLRVLNLQGNNLEGPVPAVLIERMRNGQITLSVDRNVLGNEISPSPSPSPSTSPSSPESATFDGTKTESSSSSQVYSLKKLVFASFSACLLSFSF